MTDRVNDGAGPAGERPRVVVGADHEGYRLKEKLVLALREERYPVKDVGVHNAEGGDPMEITEIAARALIADEADLAILVSGTGAGAAVAANKIAGIRAVHCQESVTARQSRRQIDANALCLGARVIGDELAVEIALQWLGEGFSGQERHLRLLHRIEQLEASFERERVEPAARDQA